MNAAPLLMIQKLVLPLNLVFLSNGVQKSDRGTLIPRINVENIYITTNALLPYNTISSDLLSQFSDLHKWKSWGHKPLAL
jgi:hypothetical protein